MLRALLRGLGLRVFPLLGADGAVREDCGAAVGGVGC